MSTRSTIYLKLHEEDRSNVFETPWGEEVDPEGKPYLSVYCHNDGYPDGVGADLLDMKMSYAEALDFILEGDHSTTRLSYWDWRRERCAPEAEDVPTVSQDYSYIIQYGEDMETPEILVSVTNENDDVEFKPVSEVL